ncbi:MAG: hypothetical protein KAR11_04740 [Phycisphaerae bacterium]|nr:hypothetical protein [Phycisphaerae bacterium]
MKNQTNNRTFSRYPGKAGGGFTLVEVLVVIAIIILLVGIIGPSIHKGMKVVKMRQTESAINMIADGCQQYQSDFDDYPPSDDANSDMDLTQGSQIIVLLLTGYPDDDPNDAAPRTSSGTGFLKDDDGKTGFGFRTVKRGRVYGPYGGAENLQTSGGDTPAFRDAFDNDILYYRYHENDDEYKAAHNTTAPVPDPNYFAACATVRTDFLLLSPGPDEVFATFEASDNTDAKRLEKIKDSDDITNLN